MLVRRFVNQKVFLEVLRPASSFNLSCHRKYSVKKTPSAITLMDHLKQRIKATGPITVASYMKEALTNPVWGYYMKTDVFGKEGDFTTSPEISQIFGELIAIWLVLQWSEMNKPTPFQLVELGPGRGTLMSDIVRVFQQFKGNIDDKFSIHFVEVSEKMKQMQRHNLKVSEKKDMIENTNIKVNWHSKIQDVPKGLSLYIAHEFFDALPVHLFQKKEGHWREILVNLSSSQQVLEFVTAPGASPLAMSMNLPEDVDQCEICPEAGVVMACISQNIAEHGGCSLIVDYGVQRSDRFSLRGFKNHELVSDVLEAPGHCDLTTNVDFGFLKQHSHSDVTCHGPVTQKTFLMQMGIRERLQALLRNANERQAQNLLSSYDYLTSNQKMGEKFKVMAVTKHKPKDPLAGFHS
ncbi:protein arginine methyltransferase NDUFAF7, mitochondrial-like [Clytia hemisphaerica]|uniref:Protein arginine methyltransferase NDUFAF7 n=1 Tax=Clytia hemisphaerica TaxID=252671 RepID=A0A7M6DPE9_9CNID